MSVVLALTLALQVSVKVGGDKAKPDSIKRLEVRDSVRRAIAMAIEDEKKRAPRRIPVTPEHERTAFHDSAARTLLLRARDARLRLDSTLVSYDASAYQRVSAGFGFRATGRDRLLFRTENASRVRWSKNGGLHVDVTGRRTALPVSDDEGDVDVGDIGPIPYYPGRDQLWVGGGDGLARAEVDERELIHPIALGAEAYYRYSAGDSLTITLSDGKSIRLRELRIEPRKPEWRFSVGSFWFDQESGQLVRAVYRFAAVMNVWTVATEEIEREKQEKIARGEKPDPDDDVPGWVKGMISPMEANLEAVTIEYGLYGGRYWMPRTQYAEGYAKAAFMRIPFKFEESYKYASVNGTDTLPTPLREKSFRELRDSLFEGDTTRWRDLPDSVRKARNVIMARVDSVRREERRARRAQECASTGFYSSVESRFEGAVKATVRMPCDTTVLAKSKDLPPSIYDDGEELFGVNERNELLKALDFSLAPVWAPLPIRVEYGLAQTRYNRVEGLSTALRASQQLGKGYSWDASVRGGTADLSLYGDLGVSRSNGRLTYRAGGYRRLAVANNDWGSPLSFGASLGSLLYGRDEGYFYRASGVELERSQARGGGLSLKAFLELQHQATWNTRFNVSRAFGSATEFFPNITAERATVAGVALRQQFSKGLDPARWRLLGDVRAEGGALLDRARGDSAGNTYGRLAGDLTVSGPLVGHVSAALTTSAGYAPNAPLQRQFFLGGAQTVRGQLLGTAAGDTYWMGRLEAAWSRSVTRPVIFGDVGWAGPWSEKSNPGRPISGVGIGNSIFDGLIRLDLSRGIYPRKQFRLDLYVEARF